MRWLILFACGSHEVARPAPGAGLPSRGEGVTLAGSMDMGAPFAIGGGVLALARGAEVSAYDAAGQPLWTVPASSENPAMDADVLTTDGAGGAFFSYGFVIPPLHVNDVAIDWPGFEVLHASASGATGVLPGALAGTLVGLAASGDTLVASGSLADLPSSTPPARPWRIVDRDACANRVGIAMVARWRGGAPDWLHCFAGDMLINIGSVQLRQDGDVVGMVMLASGQSIALGADHYQVPDDAGAAGWRQVLFDLDGETGALRWSYEPPDSTEGLALVELPDAIAVSNSKTGTWLLDPKDPVHVAPRHVSPRGTTASAPGIAGGLVAVDGQTIAEIDLASGALLWHYDFPAGYTPGIVATGDARVAVVAFHDGTPRLYLFTSSSPARPPS